MERAWTRRGMLALLATTAGCAGEPARTTRQPTTETSTTETTTQPVNESTSQQSTTTDPVDVREWPSSWYQGPLVSAHEHLHGPDGHQMTADKLDWFVHWMDRNRVAQVAGFTGDWYLDTVTAHDDRIVPFAFARSEIKNDFDDIATVFADRLDAHPAYQGVGELGLKPRTTPEGDPPLPADHPSLLELYDLVAKRDIPIMVHGSEPDMYAADRREQFADPMDVPGWQSLERAYAHNRETDFLVHSTYQWDAMNDGEIVADILDRNPNLTYDLSDLHPFAWTSPDLSRQAFEEKIAQKGVEGHAKAFYEEHAEILENYSDRLTWGMDASYDWHYTDWALDTWVDVARALLGMLPAENARDIGYRTAARLLNIDVTAPGS